MFWLVSQILGWLFLALIAGALIGWALRCRKCEHETAGLKASLERAYANNYLESDENRVSGGIYPNSGSSNDRYTDILNQLATEKEEVAGLKAKLSLAGATGFTSQGAGLSVFSGSKEIHANDGQLTWRNRYLESRVRFLEGKISDLEIVPKKHVLMGNDQSKPENSSLSEKILHCEDSQNSVTITMASAMQQDESIKKTLEILDSLNEDSSQEVLSDGISLLEPIEDFESPKSVLEHSLDELDPEILETDSLQSLVWRNRYLEGRVRYLEEEAEHNSPKIVENMVSDSKLEVSNNYDENIREGEISSSTNIGIKTLEEVEELERLRWRTRYLEGRIRFLEEEAAVAALKIEKEAIKLQLKPILPIANSLNLERLRADWRNEYLEERLKYQSLEQSVTPKTVSAKTNYSVGEQDTTVDAQSLAATRLQWREAYLAERIRFGQSIIAEEKNKATRIPEIVSDLQMDRMRWRSQYLEAKLKHAKSHLISASPKKEESTAPEKEMLPTSVLTAFDNTRETDIELVKLRWRDRFHTALAKRRRSSSEELDTREKETVVEKTPEPSVSNLSQTDISRLEWRNRYLNGRIKYLEENASHFNRELEILQTKLSENEKFLTNEHSSYGDTSDTTRLKWRNTYLLGRIGYLEENDGKVQQSFVQIQANDEKPGDALDKIDALSKLKFSNASNETISSDSVDFENARIRAHEERERKKAQPKEVQGKRATKQKTVSKVENAEGFAEQFRKSEYFVSGDSVSGRPDYLTQPLLGKHDDLREIAGVGPKIERILHDLGIYHFYQIAAWNRKEVAWVDNYLTFKGRIDRENWIDQCKQLARGEETDGQRKYRSGKHI